MKIGTVQLKHGIFCAPMAGVSDRSFRRICRSFGAEYTVSEMVSAKAICYEMRSKRPDPGTSRTAPLAAVEPDELPHAVQLFGSDPAYLAEAARLIESCTYRGCTSTVPPSAIDINMGCPVPKITGNGEGSSLMTRPELAGQIIRAVADAIRIPVTVKIRAGWDEAHINAPELAKIAEASGAAMVCVHARTKTQGYTPGIDLSVIRAVKQAVSIPVVGNGDIFCGKDALTMLSETGCDGVMIGRGSLGAPWLFSEIRAALEHTSYEEPSAEQKLEIAKHHIELLAEEKGEHTAALQARKYLAWYTKGMKGSAAVRSRIMSANSVADLTDLISSLL